MVQGSEAPAGGPFREGERRLAAIAFTDIVGYSGVVHRNERLGQKMVDRQNAVVRSVLPRFGGHIVKGTGDGFLLEFGSALSAVRAIAVIQARLSTGDESADCPVNLRASVHLGDVDHVRGDLYGDGVNTAARLMPLSPEGGIAISAVVHMQVRQQLDLPWRSIGTPALKNIEAPMEVFVAEAPGLRALGAELPANPEPEPADAATAPSAPARPSPARRRKWLKPAAILAGAAALVVAALLTGQLVVRVDTKGAAPEKSIAVLPFANLSSDKEQEYFSDGISEDLLNLLTKVQALQVAARTSSFSFKGKDVGIEEIAKALHVAHLLQGSVRKAGNSVRVTAQLVRARDGYQVWSQSWDRQLDDVFKIQDEIARAVVDELKVQLLGAAPTARPVDPAVYPLILQAETLQNQFTRESLVQGGALFEQAVAIAPNEPRAWAGLGRTLVNQVVTGVLLTADGVPRIREAADRALALDPENVTALATLGFLTGDIELDLAAAAGYYERALALEPANPMIVNQVGLLLMSIGRPDEAIGLFEQRIAQDPASPGAYNNLGVVCYFAQRWDCAIKGFRTALQMSPGISTAHFSIGLSLLLGKKDPKAALTEFEAETDEITRLAGRSIGLHALGRAAESDAALGTLVDQAGATQPLTIAGVYALRGDRDAAFKWLDEAFTARDTYLTTALVEPTLEALHDDPRWLPYLRRINLAPEQIAKIDLQSPPPQVRP